MPYVYLLIIFVIGLLLRNDVYENDWTGFMGRPSFQELVGQALQGVCIAMVIIFAFNDLKS